ncbi:hypothetical protein OY671_009689, partial [Metschnikowia pulcherrima]
PGRRAPAVSTVYIDIDAIYRWAAVKNPGSNSLSHFDASVGCRNVSRAAEQSGISQHAMSAAMNRSRQLFGDPSSVREGGAWQPTQRAHESHQGFSPSSESWRRATRTREVFDPAHSARSSSFYATDYVQYTSSPK